MKNMLKVGDIVFPYIWRNLSNENVNINPIVMFWHTERREFFTFINLINDGDRRENGRVLSGIIDFVGWCNPFTRCGNGLKIFVPEFRSKKFKVSLQNNQAIAVTRLLKNSAIGELVEFQTK